MCESLLMYLHGFLNEQTVITSLWQYFNSTLAEDGGWASTDGDAHIRLQAAEEENTLLHEEMWKVKVCSSEYIHRYIYCTCLQCSSTLYVCRKSGDKKLQA